MYPIHVFNNNEEVQPILSAYAESNLKATEQLYQRIGERELRVISELESKIKRVYHERSTESLRKAKIGEGLEFTCTVNLLGQMYGFNINPIYHFSAGIIRPDFPCYKEINEYGSIDALVQRVQGFIKNVSDDKFGAAITPYLFTVINTKKLFQAEEKINASQQADKTVDETGEAISRTFKRMMENSHKRGLNTKEINDFERVFNQ